MGTNFNLKADNWDTESRKNRAKIIAAEIRSFIKKRPFDSILDFGAGTGLIGFNLIDLAKKIIFVEESLEMQHIILNKTADYKYKSFSIFDSLHSIDYIKPTDLVVSSMAFHHIKNICEIGDDIYKNTNALGQFCIVDLMPDDGSFHEDDKEFDGYNGFDPQWLSGQFEKCGFKYCKHEVFFTDKKIHGEKEIKYSLFALLMKK